MKSIILILTSTIAFAFSDYTGEWAYTVDTPEGTISASFVLEQTDGVYTGVVKSSEGELPLKDLKIEGEKFSCHMFYTGYKVNLKGAFEGDDVLKVTADVEGMQFPIVAKKKSE